jgi:hypothetical protein
MSEKYIIKEAFLRVKTTTYIWLMNGITFHLKIHVYYFYDWMYWDQENLTQIESFNIYYF